MEDLEEGGIQGQTLLQDRDQYVDGDGNPDLSLHGVLTIAVKGFDAQVLLDPLEEEFHLPARLVQLSDGESRESEVVRQKDERAILFAVVKSYTGAVGRDSV